jgi:hypothetical protein
MAGAPVNIIDAKSGEAQTVTSTKRALTQTSRLERIAQISMDRAEAYFHYLPFVTLPAEADVAPQNPGTPSVGYPMLWWKNDSPDKALVVRTSLTSNDGGPDKLTGVNVRFAFADPDLPPTGNSIPFPTAFRLNTKNQTLPNLQVFAWDGAGNGLVLPAGSFNPIFPPGTLACPPNTTQEMPSFEAGIIQPGGPAALLIAYSPRLAAGETMEIGFQVYTYHVDIREPYA